MKKALSLLLGLFLVLVFPACEKEPIVDVDIDLTSTIFFASPETCDAGDYVTLTWQAPKGIALVTIDGMKFPNSGSRIYNPEKDKKFTIQLFVGDGILIYEDSTKVTVRQPLPPTREELLSGVWAPIDDSISFDSSEGPWGPFSLNECQKDNRLIFKLNGPVSFTFGEILCEGETSHTWKNDTWKLEGDIIVGIGDKIKASLLTESRLDLISKSETAGAPVCWFKHSYKKLY